MNITQGNNYPQDNFQRGYQENYNDYDNGSQGRHPPNQRFPGPPHTYPGADYDAPPPPQPYIEREPPPPVESEESIALRARIDEFTRQISDSEKNLLLQKNALPLLKTNQVRDAISAAEEKHVESVLRNVNLDVTELSHQLDNMDNAKCSKDTINVAKKWIFDHCQTDQLREAILMYLLARVKDYRATENFRLHILYLINDWAYYCNRKNLDSITQMLSRYVPQMYAYTVENSKDAGMQHKLEKLIGVWEGSKYFNDHCFKQLRDPFQICSTAKTAQIANYGQLAMSIEANLAATYESYEQQHNAYAAHCRQQIVQLERELQAITKPAPRFTAPPMPLMAHSIGPPPPNSARRSRFDQEPSDESWRSNDVAGAEAPPPMMHSNASGFGFFSQPIAAQPTIDDSWNPPAVPDGDDIDGHPLDEKRPRAAQIVHGSACGCDGAAGSDRFLFGKFLSPLSHYVCYVQYEALIAAKIEMPPILPPSQRILAAKDAFYISLEVEAKTQGSMEKNEESTRDDWELSVGYPHEFLERKAGLKKILHDKLVAEGSSIEATIKNVPDAEYLKLEEIDIKERDEELIAEIKKEVDAYYKSEQGKDF